MDAQQLFSDELIEAMRASKNYDEFVVECDKRGLKASALTLTELGALHQLVKVWRYRRTLPTPELATTL